MEELKKVIHKVGPLKIVVVILCGVLLVMFSFGTSFSEEAPKMSEENEEQQVQEASTMSYKEKMEQELVRILQNVEGVGKVEVMLTLRSGGTKVTLKDNTDSGDTLEEETVLVEDSERNSSPYVVQETEPELEGVVIVCEGGDNILIKKEITEAAQALFQIDSHKIKVMKSKEAKE